MSFGIEHLKKRLVELLGGDAFVVAINGEWGVGKTHFWNKFIKEEAFKDNKVAYISLFGKDNLQEIKEELLIKIYPSNKLLKNSKNFLNNIRTNLFGFNISIPIAPLLSFLEKDEFKDTIVCFDDFERLSEKLRLHDILGLISELKEQKNCKVVMILNKDKLKDNNLLIYEEKIIDYELLYEPNIDESYSSVSDTLHSFKEYPLPYFKKHNITNIRIMKKVINALNDFAFIEDNIKGYKLIEKEIVDKILAISTINAINSSISFDELSEYFVAKSVRSGLGLDGSKDDSENKTNKEYETLISYAEDVMDYYPTSYKIKKIITDYTRNSIIDKKFLADIIEEGKVSDENEKISRNLRNAVVSFEYDFTYSVEEYVQNLNDIFEKCGDDIINIIDSQYFIFLISTLKKYDQKKASIYHEFAIKVLKVFLGRLLDGATKEIFWSKRKIDDIKAYDKELEIYYNDCIDGINQEKINSVEKLIDLMKKSIDDDALDLNAIRLLPSLEEELIERYMLENKYFLEALMGFIGRFGGVSGVKEINTLEQKIAKVLNKLKKSDNRNHSLKAENLLKTYIYNKTSSE